MRYRLSERLIPLKNGEDFADGDIRVDLMSVEEFKNMEEALPHKRVLLHLLMNVQYCKAETFGNCMIGTFVVPRVRKLSVGRTEFGFYITKDRIIFIEQEDGLAEAILARLKDANYGDTISAAVFFADFLNSLIEADSVFLQEYEERLIEMESSFLKNSRTGSYEVLLTYRKDMMRLHTYFTQLEDLGDVLRSNINHLFNEEELELLAIFTHHVSRLNSHTEMLREYIVQIHDMYESLLNVAQNRTMNLLTVVTTIFLPLSLIAGWYGMNFSNMPELSWQHGYLWVAGVSLLIILIEIYIFRKKHLL